MPAPIIPAVGLALVMGLSLGELKSCSKEEITPQEAKAINKPTFTVGDCVCMTYNMYKGKCFQYVHKIIDFDDEAKKAIIVQGNLPNFTHWYAESVITTKEISQIYTPVECPKENEL